MTNKELFGIFDKLISNKYKKEMLTLKTYVEYNSISSRLQKYLTESNSHIVDNEFINKIDSWQNGNKNKICVNVVKHQLQIIILSSSL